VPGVQMFKLASWQEIMVCHSAVYTDRFSDKYAMGALKMLQEGPTQKTNEKPLLDNILKQFSPAWILTYFFFKMHFNIVFSIVVLFCCIVIGCFQEFLSFSHYPNTHFLVIRILLELQALKRSLQDLRSSHWWLHLN